MSTIDLSQYGIKNVKEIIHNPSYEQLFKDETDPSLEGFEKGTVTELGAVNVMTGVYTGRSPKEAGRDFQGIRGQALGCQERRAAGRYRQGSQ